MNDLIYDKPNIKLWQGDSLEVLKSMPNESVDMCITSPPYYGLRIYLHKDHPNYKHQVGLENTYQDYLAKMLLITAEIKRVLKKTGSFWLNCGDSYNSAGTNMPRYFDGRDKNFDKGKEFTTEKDIAEKCLLMMPERLALAMCDQQGWILRNKIRWVKQIYIHKQKRTIGSVMPTSVKDRFNESGEELYFFVKSKKYYADLDSVRLNIQTFEDRPDGITRSREYQYDSKFLKDYSPKAKQSGQRFNYRVRDAKKKSDQCPQFKATKEEIAEYKQKTGKIKGGGANLNLPWDPVKGGQLYAPADHRNKNDTTEKNYGLKKYQGKFAGKEDAEMFNSPRARTQRKLDKREFDGRWGNDGKGMAMPEKYNSPNGKNLPSCWLIGTEPHNFSREYHCEVDHFATFPQDLVEIPIKFACPPGGIVMDPFSGSFTTGVVALKLKRKFIGIELNEQYIKQIGIPRLEKIIEENKNLLELGRQLF